MPAARLADRARVVHALDVVVVGDGFRGPEIEGIRFGGSDAGAQCGDGGQGGCAQG
jgi:hypothetical protein